MASLSNREMEIMALINSIELAGREISRQYYQSIGQEISYGTLYTTLRRLKDVGWVHVRDEIDSDCRTKYFKLTDNGRQALKEHFEHVSLIQSLLNKKVRV